VRDSVIHTRLKNQEMLIEMESIARALMPKGDVDFEMASRCLLCSELKSSRADGVYSNP
jgi:hypothetical protein